jgi:hypothetical protein
MNYLDKIHTSPFAFDRITAAINSFFWAGKKLTFNQRSARVAFSLIEPVLSLTDVLTRPWEIGFELASIFMIITSFTGVCIAGKTLKLFKAAFNPKKTLA